MNKIYVNFGCGNRYDKQWTNLDFSSNNEYVQECDLRKRLPFEDNSVEVIYSSHMLEHFPKNEAPSFVQECYRILKPKGLIRMVVPDLEQLIKNYSKFLAQARRGDVDAQEKYEWTLIELFDQMVRNFSGGEMLEYWKQNPMPQEDFVVDRCGMEVKAVLNNVRKARMSTTKRELTPQDIGEFRTSGEVHQWMYDDYSLQKLLESSGFSNAKRVEFNESSIPSFNEFLLDCDNDGNIRKPDSLFMEARK